jgi:hypothetical protein
MKRAKLEMMKRNAIIVAGNALRQSGDNDLHQCLERIAVESDEPPMVRDTATAVLRSIGPGNAR